MTVDKQPEALRLADVFDKEGYAVFTDDMWKAAAELRRLHSVEKAFQQWITKTEWVQETATCKELGYHRADVIKQRFDRLIAQRGELLEALRNLADLYDTDEGCRSLPEYIAARAAIAKATGETK